MTVEKISRAYGISATTVHKWRKRGIAIDDFRDPATVFRKLCDTLKNCSPRILALRDPITQCEIVFRLAVSGAISPKK
jgi:transposase-like protein